MNNLPNINMLLSRGRIETAAGLKSGKSSSNDIFESILNKINSKGSSNWVSNLYSDNSADNSLKSRFNSTLKNLNSVIKTSGKNHLNRLQKNNNPDQMIFPAALHNQLVAFLEKQGFTLKDINQVISASKNETGFIQFDKLVEGLSSINPTDASQGFISKASFKDSFSSFLSSQGIDPIKYNKFFSGIQEKNSALSCDIKDLLTKDPENSSFIEASRVPGAGQVLFKIGIGAGEVKKIIEKSLNGNGELEISKLNAEVNKLLTAPLSEPDLVSLLSNNNISVGKRIFSSAESKSGINSLLSGSDRQLTDEMQKELNKNIETVLKDKGVPEEDINSFLKSFNSTLIKMKLEEGFDLKEADQLNQKILSMLEGESKIISEVLWGSLKDDISSFLKNRPENKYAFGDTDQLNQKNLNMLEGERKIISGALGDPAKDDIASFLKSRGVPDRDVKSFLENLSIDLKKADISRNENYSKSAILNEKAFGSSKNDQLPSSSDQGNLKLNVTELIKLAAKESNANGNTRSIDANLQSGASVKNSSAGKESSGFIVKEASEASGLNIFQQKEINNIAKVNQSNRAMDLPQPLPRIVERMIIMFRTGEYQSRLKITPPELGKLDIDLTIKNGHIHANLSTENAAVKEIIEANLNQLKNQLSNQGLTVDRFEVMVGLENREHKESNTWAEGRRGKGSGRNTGSKLNDSSDVLVSAAEPKSLVSDNQIDVHV